MWEDPHKSVFLEDFSVFVAICEIFLCDFVLFVDFNMKVCDDLFTIRKYA